jgi:2-methylcitrate dehydratase PrpD
MDIMKCQMKTYLLKYFQFIIFFTLNGIACLVQAQPHENTVSRMLAELTINTQSSEISENAYEKAKMALMDIIGTSFAGYESSGISEIKGQALEWGGKKEAAIWFTGQKVPSQMAGFVNGSMAHAMDMDDWHRSSQTHISTVTVPTAITIGEMMGSGGQEVLDAIIIGVEIAGRIGEPFNQNKKHQSFLPTSVIGGFAATAIACRLMKLSVDQTINAFGIYYSQASGNRQALFDHTLTKRIQPGLAVKAGITAAFFARKGITGPENIFLSNAGLLKIYGCASDPLPEFSTFEKQKTTWEIEDLEFKKYACCGISHAVIEGAIRIAQSEELVLEDIESIELFGIFGGYAGTPWQEAENPHVLAQFCAPYQVVSAIKNKKFGPEEISFKKIKEDTDVAYLAKKVQIKHPKDWGPGYPGSQYKTIRIHTKEGETFVRSFLPTDILHPFAFNMKQIIDKMFSNINYSGLCTSEKADDIVQSILQFESVKNIEQFVNAYLIRE